MTAQALQFAGSLAAILLLAWLARRLGLGGDTRLQDADEARRIAEDAVCGFDAQAVALDAHGAAALVQGADGRVLLLRRHGAHWAVRAVDAQSRVASDGGRLTVAPADKPFGSATLDLGDLAQDWAARLQACK